MIKQGRYGIDYYQNNADKYYNLRQGNLLWEAKHVTEEAIVLKHAKGLVLDAGCGNGRLSEKLDNVIRHDVSQAMLDKCSDKHKKILGRLEDMEFEDSTFDTIICIRVLFLLDDWETVLREYIRILKPGGKMLLQFNRGFGRVSSEVRYKQPLLPVSHIKSFFKIYGGKVERVYTYDLANTLSLLGWKNLITTKILNNRRLFKVFNWLEFHVYRFFPTWMSQFYVVVVEKK